MRIPGESAAFHGRAREVNARRRVRSIRYLPGLGVGVEVLAAGWVAVGDAVGALVGEGDAAGAVVGGGSGAAAAVGVGVGTGMVGSDVRSGSGWAGGFVSGSTVGVYAGVGVAVAPVFLSRGGVAAVPVGAPSLLLAGAPGASRRTTGNSGIWGALNGVGSGVAGLGVLVGTVVFFGTAVGYPSTGGAGTSVEGVARSPRISAPSSASTRRSRVVLPRPNK